MTRDGALVWDESVEPALQPRRGAALAIGTFDGVHLGHQAIVRRMDDESRRQGRPAAVLTFHPHPRQVLTPAEPPQLLTSLQQRVAHLKACGSAGLVVGVLQFSRRFAQIPAQKFVTSVLVDRLQAGAVYVGYNFAFGRHRGGDVDLLQRLGDRLGLEVTVMPPVELDGEPVSSSRIRRHLRAGEAAAAARQLGRPYRLTGEVVRGAGRGRKLGFPTANLMIPPQRVLPKDGVYVVEVNLAGQAAAFAGVCNIGTRPTFGQGERQLEVHLLDFDADLYGQVLTVAFRQRLRGERSFAGPQALGTQLKADVAEVRRRTGGTGAS